jgi:type I restriction enzyme S subunit
MTGRYQEYPEYKDSGVEWLSDLPANWRIERTKRMFSLKRSLVGNQSSNYQLLSLTLKGVISRDISSGEGKIPESFDTYQKVDKDDLIFCLFDIDETPRTIGISPLNGMITGAYNVYGCLDNCYSAYAYYYFFHIDSFKGLKPFYTGLRKVVRAETFSNIEMPCPSFDEQQKIANFLDHETAKIDTLIAKQENLIELLKEKRQAVISHAVTRGLNPDAPMKDSGVEWLGYLPKHWLHSALKHYSDVIDCKHITAEFFDDGIPLASIGEVKGWFVNLTNAKLTNEEYYHDLIGGGRTPQVGDIIYSRNATVGEAAIVSDNLPLFALGQDVCLLRQSKKISSEYLMFVLHSGVISQQLELAMVGSTFKRINVENIKSFLITVPPFEEQEVIVRELEKKLSQYDSLISNAVNAIELMKERKTALISAAVTGKIDVRNYNTEKAGI